MSDFTGMTRATCPSACNADRCVISEHPMCAHPCMGGLQEALQTDLGAVTRFAAACKAVGIIRNSAGILTKNELAQ